MHVNILCSAADETQPNVSRTCNTGYTPLYLYTA